MNLDYKYLRFDDLQKFTNFLDEKYQATDYKCVSFRLNDSSCYIKIESLTQSSDENLGEIKIKNYTDRIMFRAFGTNVEPTYDDYLVFLEDRCFPRTRDRLKLVLDDLGIPFYDPFLIVEKTKGKMAEDDFWIMIER